MLARNKELINELTYNQGVLKDKLRLINMEISDLCLGDNSMYLKALYADKTRKLESVQKNSKSLKQLAAIQKAIKEEIRMNDSRDSYLLMLVKKD